MPPQERVGKIILLPVKRPAECNLAKNTDRKRRKCEVFGCHYYGVAVLRLDRYMRKIHGTTTKERGEKDSIAECSFSSEEDLDDADSCLSAEISIIANNL